MATPCTRCDNIIIQAVANQLNCVIHIIESRLSCTQGSTINPSTALANVKVLFVGYIEDLHCVSTIPNSHTTKRNPLYHLKSKLLQSDEKNKRRNQDRRDAKQRKRKQKQTTGNTATWFPGSLFSASLTRWIRDPSRGWSRDHLFIPNRRVGGYSSTFGQEQNPVAPPFQQIFLPPRFWVVT